MVFFLLFAMGSHKLSYFGLKAFGDVDNVRRITINNSIDSNVFAS